MRGRADECGLLEGLVAGAAGGEQVVGIAR